MGIRAGIYCRISDDRAGAGLGVARQEADCRALATARGWDVVEVFADNDLSAYSGKSRPGYRALLAASNDGQLDAIVAWHPDRLHRSPVELEEFIAVCEGRELDVVTVQAGQIDLSTPSGRMVARMLGSAARYESEHKAERQRRKALELARAGKVSGGGTRAYGFEKDFMTIRPDEAAIIRVITERFLAGESLGSLVSWLNANEVPTSGGGSAWRLFTLRRLLRSARISGQREHRGEILGPGEWEQIITPQQTARIRAILDDPARKNRRSPRRYLLASMLRCGKCGATLASRPRDDGQRRYVCTKGIDYHGCGSLYVPAEPLEDLIARAVLIPP